MLNEVPNDQEVRREPHVGDDLEFIDQTLDDVIGNSLAPTFFRTFECEMTEVLRAIGKALGKGKVRELRISEFDFNIAPFRNPERVVAGFGNLIE